MLLGRQLLSGDTHCVSTGCWSLWEMQELERTSDSRYTALRLILIGRALCATDRKFVLSESYLNCPCHVYR